MAARFGTGTAAVCGLLLGALTLVPGCRPSREDRAAGASEAGTAEWEWLQKARQQLDGERERLARLEAAATGEAPAALLPPDTARLRKKVRDLSAELNRRLVDFINANASHSPGDPLSERQRAAIRMKSDEDILLAREYVEQAGDYRRAIEIYETALAADPDNERLRKELEAARARRYVTRERFERVKEGMTRDEVRRLLGPPNAQDVRSYPERGVIAWFYPKDASGAAAAVWFHRNGDATEAYLLDFDAIQPSALTGAPADPPRRQAHPARPRGTPAPPTPTPQP